MRGEPKKKITVTPQRVARVAYKDRAALGLRTGAGKEKSRGQVRECPNAWGVSTGGAYPRQRKQVERWDKREGELWIYGVFLGGGWGIAARAAVIAEKKRLIQS